MRKTILLILIAGAIVLFGTKVIGVDTQPEPGRQAPELTLIRNDTAVSLQNLRGRYVLVDFWSSADANSRLKSNEYNRLPISSAARLERLSINFDRSEELFNEILRRDHLNPEEEYFAGESDFDKIIRDYGITQGYNSYLIDPQGKIVAVNPDNEYISSYFNQRPTLTRK